MSTIVTSIAALGLGRGEEGQRRVGRDATERVATPIFVALESGSSHAQPNCRRDQSAFQIFVMCRIWPPSNSMTYV